MARTGPFRGGIVVGANMYGAWTGEVYTVNLSGDTVLFSTLAGTDFPTFARNSLSPTPSVAVVTDAGPFIINSTAGAVQAYPDNDVLLGGANPTCCCGYMGYLFFGYATGEMIVTSFNSTSINTLNQVSTITNFDGIKNIFGYNGQIYAMGARTVEIWGEPINATGFPLTRAGFNITPGLMGKHAVAGWEQGWGYPPIYVGADGTVRQLEGFQATKISSTDVDRDIRIVNHSDAEEIECLVYNTGGHAFWQMNLPTKSWVYHVNEGTWHERQTIALTRSKFQRSVHFGEQWITGDTETTDLLAVDIDNNREGSDTITAVMESGPVKQFPNRQRIVRTDFDFTVGMGVVTGTEPIETDPQVQLEVSYDGGHTWPHSWNRKLGKQAEYNKRVFINSPGITGDEGARWRWSISDPIHVGFQGADMVPSVISK
jgi:hypothetical protein